jgi:gamma-glutamyl phosphate reductase
MASDITFNAKVQRPGVCNAIETCLCIKMRPGISSGMRGTFEKKRGRGQGVRKDAYDRVRYQCRG